MSSCSRSLRIEHQHLGVVGKEIDEHLHLVDECGREGFHALHGDALGELLGHLHQRRVAGAEFDRAAPDLIGEKQFATRRRPDPTDRLEGPLVRHRERPNLLHLIAPELDPQGVLLGGREDVDQPTANGVLTASLDQVDPHIGGRRKALDHVLKGHRLSGLELDRGQLAQTGDLRLQQRPHRCDDDAQRAGAGLRAGMGKSAENGQALADRVATRTQPLMGQRLPVRVERDQLRIHQVLEGVDQGFAFASGRRHHEQGASHVGQRLGQERPHRRGGRSGRSNWMALLRQWPQSDLRRRVRRSRTR